MIVNYNRTIITIVNYDRETSKVQATEKFLTYEQERKGILRGKKD